MKRKWTKLLAVMLAGVMALSCTVFAAASEHYQNVNTLNGEGAVIPSDTGEAPNPADPTPEQKVETKYAGGSAKGVARSEGPLPADPIRLELPTVDARTLDMILDPHGLIKRTGMARYGGTNVSFSDDTTLYFLNKITGTATGSGDVATTSGGLLPGANASYSYTNETQSLTITNKSNLPVGIDVTLRVDKGLVSGDDFDFTFVDTTDDLEGEDAEEDALMYLALKNGDVENAVVDYEDDEDVLNPPTVSVGSGDDLEDAIAATPIVSGDALLYNTYPKATFQWAKAVPEAEEGAEETPTEYADVLESADKEDFIDDIDGKIITMTYVASGDKFEIEAEAPASGDYDVNIIVDGVSMGEEGVITNTTRDVSVTVAYYEEGDTPAENTDVAYVYFVVKAGSLSSCNDGDDVTLTIEQDETVIDSTDMGYAHFSQVLPKPEDAYVEGWDAVGGYFWAFLDDYQDTAGKAKLQEWKHTSDGTATGTPKSFTGTYPSLSFSITGSINGSQTKASPWDGHGDQIKLDLIWDVFAVDPDAEGGGGGAVDLNAGKPAITAVSKATGTTTSSGKATITFTPGSGQYEGYAPSAFVHDGTADALAGSTATTAVVQTKNVRSETTFALRFAKDGATVDVPITDALW